MINEVADQQSLSRHISGNCCLCVKAQVHRADITHSWKSHHHMIFQVDSLIISRHDTSFVQRQVNTQQTNFLQISKYILEENTVLDLIIFLYNWASQYLVEHKKILAQARRSRSEERARTDSVQVYLKEINLATNGLNLSKWGLIRCKIFADSLRHKKLHVLKVDNIVIKPLPAKALTQSR